MIPVLSGSIGVLSTWRKLAAAGSTLLNGLVSLWPLNELSGTRYDVVGTNHLTDVNTVGAVLRGPEGTVASFAPYTSGSEYLSKTDFVWPSTFTLSFWSNPGPDPTVNYQAGFYLTNESGGGSPNNLAIGVGSYGYPDGWYIADGTFGSQGISLQGSHRWRGWHMYTVTYDGTTVRFYGDLAEGTPLTKAWTLDNGIILNRLWSYSGSVNAFTVNAGRVGVWGTALSAEQIATLHASGNGLDYADLPAGLLADLVSWWELDELSGVRYDSHGDNDLTDNNTVGSVNSGPVGTVAAPVLANSEYFSLTDSATTVWGEDGNGVTFAGWVKITEPAGTGNGAMLLGPSTGNRKFEIWSNSTGDKFAAQTYVPTDFDARAESLAVATGVWHFIVGWFSPVDKKTHIQVDLATVVDSTGTCASGTLPAASGATWFGLSPYGANDKMGGAWGRWGVWNRVLSSDERTSLFNSGIGKSYADLTAAEKVGLVSYWDLSEASGDRADSHGSNTLTDNNSVLSVINASGAMHNAAASFVAANNESLSVADYTAPADYSISVWTKANSLASLPMHFLNAINSWPNNTQFAIAFNNVGGIDKIQATVGDGSDYKQFASTDAVAAATWYHIVLTYTSADKTGRLYVNNVDGGSDTLTGAADRTAATLNVGDWGSYNLDGLIDEVAIWSRVLTADERTELFNLGRGKYYDFA